LQCRPRRAICCPTSSPESSQARTAHRHPKVHIQQKAQISGQHLRSIEARNKAAGEAAVGTAGPPCGVAQCFSGARLRAPVR
jgi:hypothetical protein